MERFTALEAYNLLATEKEKYLKDTISIVYKQVVEAIKNAIAKDKSDCLYFDYINIPLYCDIRDKIILLLEEDGYEVINKIFESNIRIDWKKPKALEYAVDTDKFQEAEKNFKEIV